MPTTGTAATSARPPASGGPSRAGSSPRCTGPTWPVARPSATSPAAANSSTNGRSTPRCPARRGRSRTPTSRPRSTRTWSGTSNPCIPTRPCGPPSRRRSLAASSPPPRARPARSRTGSARSPTSTRPTGVPYFNPDVIGDLATRGQRHSRVMGSAEALIRGATQMARPVAEFGAERHVPLGDFLNTNGRAGLRSTIRQVRLTDAELNEIGHAGFHARSISARRVRTPRSPPRPSGGARGRPPGPGGEGPARRMGGGSRAGL
jgi:hypothetical protein